MTDIQKQLAEALEGMLSLSAEGNPNQGDPATDDPRVTAAGDALLSTTQQEDSPPSQQPERHWSLDDDEAVQALMDRDMED